MKSFAPNRVLDHVAPRLGGRMGVAYAVVNESKSPPRKSLGRSGASPHQV
jgi:hypothetical protein